MTAVECVATLREFNAWRRGEDKEMLDVKQIGLAIDQAIQLIEQRGELMVALIAFRDGGPEGGRDFNGWHDSYIPAIELARAAIASAEGGTP